MANLSELTQYDAGVYQLEVTDPVAGGAAGISNAPLKNLANRTAYLKSHVDAIEAGTTVPAVVAKLASPEFTGTPTAPTASPGINTTQIATTAFVIAERSATASLSGKTITGLKETKVAMATLAIDLAAGNYFTKTISGASTLTVSNIPATGTAGSFILELTNGGSAAVTWFAGVKWAGGIAPTLTAAGVDILGFYTHDAGTTWRGLVLAKDSK